MQFFLQVSDKFLHDCVYLLVVERFLLVLEDEVHGVRLFAFGQILAFIDIEEFDALEEFPLRLISNLLNLHKLYALVDEQGEVATDWRELADFLIVHGGVAHGFHECRPIQFGIAYRILYLCRLEQASIYQSHYDKHLSASVLDGDSFGENVVVAVLEYHRADGQSYACEDIHHISLQFIERTLLVGMYP